MLSFEGEHEVSLLLEPAPPTPFSVVVQSLLPLLATTAEVREGVRAAKEGDSNASEAPGLTAGPGSKQATDDAAATTTAATAVTAESVRRDLEAAGIVEATFGSEELKWRWRLVNVAVRAGAAGGQRMSLPQLQYLRAELDFRMLHMRHAALVRHCQQQLQGRLRDAVSDAAEAVPRGSVDCKLNDGEGVLESHAWKERNGAVHCQTATAEGSTGAAISLDEGRTVRTFHN
jgi:hypothetical protein